MTDLLSQMARTWCHLLHPAPRWPIHGQYECPTCLRRYPVPWASQTVSDSSRSAALLVHSAGMTMQPAEFSNK